MTRGEAEKKILEHIEEIRQIAKAYAEELELPEQRVHITISKFYSLFSIIDVPEGDPLHGLYLLETTMDRDTRQRKHNRFCEAYEGVLKEERHG